MGLPLSPPPPSARTSSVVGTSEGAGLWRRTGGSSGGPSSPVPILGIRLYCFFIQHVWKLGLERDDLPKGTGLNELQHLHPASGTFPQPSS